MKKRYLLAGAFLSTQASAQQAPAPDALPEGGRVVAGDASLGQETGTLRIQQSTDRAAIDWDKFDVGRDAQVEFLQPSSDSVTLNRVTGNDASRIFGRIAANGQVFLSNPNGLYFSPTASVNVGGLVATTHEISLEDFMAGRAKFERDGATGSIVNQGELQAALGGYIALLAPEVRNQGVILANLGTVALAAGETFELQFGGNNTLANLRVTPSTIQALVDNQSAVLAPGGIIILSAQAVDRVQGGVIRNGGVLEATGLAQRGGRIVLEASDLIVNTGRIDASATGDGPAGVIGLDAPQIVNGGTIDVSGSTAHPDGGRIEIAAGDFVQTPTGFIAANAPAAGGAIDIEASGQVVLEGSIDAVATGDAPDARGGTVAVDAARIQLVSFRADVSGSVGGRIALNAAAPANRAPTAPLPTPEPGKLAVVGNAQLSSRGRRGHGGAITLLGDDVALRDAATLTVSGASGGGEALIGGGWQGSGDLHQATTVTMGADVLIDASATGRGDGGTMVLWSNIHDVDSVTAAHGTLLAQGGAEGGQGGRIETSGHTLAVSGTAQVRTGPDGVWLLDPADVTIANSDSGYANVGGVYTPSSGAASATVNVATLVAALDSGNVTITTRNTGTSGSGNGDILVTAGIAKTGGTDSTLTLRAARDIRFNGAGVSSSNSALNLVLIADDDTANGGAVFFDGGIAPLTIGTNGGHLWVGGNGYNGGNAYADGTWNGLTVGTGVANSSSATGVWEGVNVKATTIDTAGGDVYIAGRNARFNSGEDRYGVVVQSHGANHSGVSAGAGSITIHGGLQALSGSLGTLPTLYGVAIRNATVQTTTGAISITGGEGATEGNSAIDSYGVYVGNSQIRTTGSSGGAITLTGTVGTNNGSANARDGVRLHATGANAAMTVLSVAGNITITGTSYNTNNENSTGIRLITAQPTNTDANNPVVRVVSQTGDVTLTGDSPNNSNDGNNSGGIYFNGVNYGKFYIGYDGTNAYSGNTTLSARSLMLSNMYTGYLNLGGSGALAIEPIGDGFVRGAATGQSLTINGVWNLGSAHSSLRLGKDVALVGSGSHITIDTALTAAGPIRLYGDAVQINADLTTTAASAEIVAKARSNVVMSAGRALQTNGGDITLWADSNAASGGYILLTNNNRLDSRTAAARTANAEASNGTGATGGGDITLAGGNGVTAADGHAESANAANRGGVNLGDQIYGNANVTTIYSGGGDVLIRGRQTGGAMMGVNWVNGGLVNAGQGTVRIEGLNTGTGSHGVELGSWRSSGMVEIFAGGGSAATPAIAVNAIGSGAANSRGLALPGARFFTTGTGGITLTGDGGANGLWGIGGALVDAQAVSGAITLDGGSRGISMAGSLGARDGSPITASSSNITLTGDRVQFSGEAAVRTSGTLTVQPSGSSFTDPLSWPLSNLTLTSSVSGLTLGRSGNTSDIVIADTLSIAGPVAVYGGNLTLNGSLTATAAGAGILLKAAGNLTTAASRTLQTNNGDLVFWSDSDGNGSGAITLGDNFTLNSANGATGQATGGGNITLAGGTTGTGPAASTTGHAVSLGTSVNNNGALYSGGGNVTINGKTTTTSASDAYHGAVSWGALTLDAGQGTIAFTGESADSYGLTFSRGGPATATTLRSAATGGTAIGLSGTTTAANTHGLVLDFTAQENILATGGGGIALTGRGTGTSYGVWLQGSNLLASSGAITVDGGNAGIHVQNASRLGKSTTGVTASSSNVTLSGDRLSLADTLTVDTTGTFTVQPYGTSFASALTWPVANLTLAGTVSGLTLGKSGNTANITVGGATSIAGPIAIHGGNIALDAALTATGSTITLEGTGNVTRGVNGHVAADSLRLLGGNVTLDGTSNAIGTLAASGVGTLTYVDSNALALGTVGGTNGVSASGAVSIATLSGDLTIAQNVATTNATATALTLNAGSPAAAGTAAGGNVVVLNGATVGVGAGGRGRLFSGSVAGSTGLTALIGGGSGRFRYGSDESAANYTLALGTGLHAIYREQPTVTRVVDDQSIVYGDSLPTFTFTLGSGVNGDTYAQAFATAPTVSVGGAQSSSGNWIAGAHALTGTGGSSVSQLGYAVGGGIASGTLTVTPRTLAASYSAVGREYDGTTAAAVIGSDDRLGGDLLNVTHVAAAFDDANAGNGKTVDITGIALSGTDAGNYTLAATSATTTANVTPRTVTLSANRVYDGTTALGAGTVAIGNLAGSETLSFSGASANDAHVATAGKHIDAIVLVDGTNGGLAGNYALPLLDAANAPVTITPRALTGSATIGGTLSRTYDGTTGAAGASIGGSISGAVGGDTLSLDLSAVSLAYDSAHVASATNIGATGTVGFGIDASAHGSQASDYVFSAPALSPVAASITPATLTPTLTNTGVTRAYDGTTSAPGGFTPAWSLAGLVSGDTAAALGYTGAQYDGKDVATASNLTVAGLGIDGITGANGSAVTDYVLDATSKSVAATITPRAVTVGGLVADDKSYDGTDVAAILDWGHVDTGVGSETLVLVAAGATFSDANAGAGKTVTATGYALFNGSNGGLAANYALTGTTATTTADIDRAVLTVIANDDAKFVTQPDASGYNGVSYSGFANGETAAVLTGSASIARSNAGVNTAGTYADVLTPDVSGLSSGNYSFAPQNGDYTIVAANELLVRVANDDAAYGTEPGFTIDSAEYLDGSTNTVTALTSIGDDGHGRFTVSDGAGGSASFTIVPEDAPLSGAGFARVGTYQLGAAGITTQNAQNFSNRLTLVGSRSITPRAIGATTIDGVGKIYDGTTAMTGISLGLVGAESADDVSVSGTGAFGSRNAGSNIGYTLSNLVLGGDDAANYHLTGGGSFSGNNGTIAPRALTVSYGGVSRAYDGSTQATVVTADDRIDGDAFAIVASAAFADKNVGTGKAVAVSGVTLGGADAGNYTVGSTGSTTADITRLDSVAWIGGAGGNWFDPANWAGGAVPDLANVANVIVPAGVNVTFDPSGAVAPAEAGAVRVDSLGNAGSLTQIDGELAVGAGGVTLDGFAQRGGTLESGGAMVLGSFEQTGGSTATTGDFAVDGDFSQGSGGSVTVGGHASIVDTAGGATLGNLSVGGELRVESTDGPIAQARGTSLTVGGNTTIDAGGHDIALDGASNDFVGAFSASGRNVLVTDGRGGLMLGNVTASGTFGAASTNGDLTQASGSTLVVAGGATLEASGGRITLHPSGNQFGGGLTVIDASSNTVMPPMPPPAAPVLVLPSPRSAPSVDGFGTGNVFVSLVTAPSDEIEGLVRVDVPRDRAHTGFSFALPEEATRDLPADRRITAAREDGTRLPAWLTFDPRDRRFVASAIPGTALPLRAIVMAGERRLTVVIANAETP